MTLADIAAMRVYSQRINIGKFTNPEDVVGYMVAMQAQEYAFAKWAIGLRMISSTNAAVEKAMNTGVILRTHVLRPTWHFVLPKDIRWLLSLTAPRIDAGNATMYKKQEVDSTIFNKSHTLLIEAMEGGKQLTRLAITEILNSAGIATNDLRLTILLMKAELDQIICSGGREGKQFTYALLDERAPVVPALQHDEALAQLVLSYFTSHGPATVNDFVHWSGLTVADAKKGIEVNSGLLGSIVVEGKTYWMSPGATQGIDEKPANCLLPVYDELIIAYKNRDAMIPAKYRDKVGDITFFPTVMVNNQVIGNWSRNISKTNIAIEIKPFGNLNKAQTKTIETASKRFKKFNGL